MAMPAGLKAQLHEGVTTLCRCWSVHRSDGEVLGFTDHDLGLGFDGIWFKADTGLTAFALQQSTGLSVDNSEALGVLQDTGVSEADIEAGRFDGAEVRSWLVNWADPAQRHLQFRGTIGEIKRAGGAFEAELRGMTEALNVPMGRVFQKPCTAVLGDAACRFDTGQTGFSMDVPIDAMTEDGHLLWSDLGDVAPQWFARGRMTVLTGAANGLWTAIKGDHHTNAGRRIELWTPVRASLAPGDMVRLEAGCDKRAETCQQKFDNFLNYQGFPDIPGEDWLMASPRSGNPNTGGSRR